jgi:pimeloyl-ACP methyl ester carboxylesterase
MPKIEINGARLWYDVQGDGQPLFCIGGMALVSDQYAFTTPILAKNFKVINFDIRGVGKSAPLPSLNYREYQEQAEDVKGIVDALGLEKVHIWSGACSWIGIEFAARYPERTASLIFFPWLYINPQARSFFNLAKEGCKAFGTMEFWAKLITMGWADPRTEDWALSKFSNNISCESFMLHWDTLKNCDLRDRIPKIKVPALMLIGADSGGRPKDFKDDIKYVKDNVPGVETVFIKGSVETYYMIDNPEKTSQIVTEWLEKHPIR